MLPTRLWTEGTHSGWGSEEARRRVDAEMLRSRPPDGPVLRAVLLRHADPPFELVVTADRRDLDRTALAIVCDVLLGTIGADTVAADPVRRHEDGRILVADARARRSTRVWRTPDGVLLGPEPWDRGDSDLTTAVAVAAATVAGRYEALDSVSVPVWRVDPDRPRNVLGGYEHCVCLTIDTSGARTAYEVLPEAVRARHRRRPLDAAEAYGPGGVAASLVGVLGAVPREFERVYLPCQSAPFPLTLVPFVDSDGRATLEVYADPAKVGEATAVRFGLRVAEVVRALSTTPKTPARHRGSVIFGTVDPAPVGAGVRPSLESAEQRIEDLFAAHVRARPDAIAVTHGRRTLTYAELDERSRWVSGGLQELGVTAGDRVGICLDRSVDLIVVMLAVLRTGAGFVPMDVRHPPKRLADTARDAGVRLVVGELEDSAWSDGVPVVSPRDLEMSEPGRSDVVGHGEATAYVIYTSGSTGRPKGVAVPHRAVLALLAATTEEFALTPDDTWSLFHSPAFDFSVWEIWGALLTGARIVIVPYWISRSPVEFHTLLSDEHVTILSQTPSAFTHLVAADPGLDPLDSVRLVVFGGETLDPRAVLPWLDRYPESSCRLVNMYGTTETTVHVTARTVTRRDALSGSRSVGLPLRGWEIHVVDEDGRPLPRGMAGEIVVGGVGVSHGYLNRRGLTATRFVAAPGGGRRYRTGDRGRLHDDGTLEHLGRLDTQVQIRGFRVELGEIRGVLLTDPAVTAAAVVSSGGADGAGDLTIDAYVVLAEDTSSSATTIRRGLARLLPEHMMPRTVTELAALPLGVNGKLDTARLPDPAPGSREARRRRSRGVPEPDGARGMAGTLTDIWESVLGVSVSPDDNLFELGGNSLCAIKAETMMRRLGLPGLPMRELYRHPSIRGICDALARLYPPRPDT